MARSSNNHQHNPKKGPTNLSVVLSLKNGSSTTPSTSSPRPTSLQTTTPRSPKPPSSSFVFCCARRGGGSKTTKQPKYVKPRIGSSFQATVTPVSSMMGGGGGGAGATATSSSSLISLVMAEEDSVSNGVMTGVVGSVSIGSGNGGGKRKRGAGGRRTPPKRNMETAGNVKNSSGQITPIPSLNPSATVPSRGGLCIHRPTISHPAKRTTIIETNNHQHLRPNRHQHPTPTPTPSDQFVTFARNLLLQTPRTHPHDAIATSSLSASITASTSRGDFLWREALDQNQYGGLLVGNSSSSSGGVNADDNGGGGGGNMSGNGSSVKIVASLVSSSKRKRKRKMKDCLNTTKKKSGVVPPAQAHALQGSSDTATDPDETDTNSQQFPLKTQPQQQRRRREVALGLENDEQILEYLQVNHGGERGRAEFMLLTDVCRGRATKTRKNISKIKKRNDMNAPLSAVLAPLSDSWRRRYERFGPSPIGDLRREPGICRYPFVKPSDGCDTVDDVMAHSILDLYPWSSSTTTMSSTQLDASTAMDLPIQKLDYNVEKNEKLMKTWKQILESGQAILQQLAKPNNNPDTPISNPSTTTPTTTYTTTTLPIPPSSSSKHQQPQPPSLRNILILVGKAHSIPKPEDVFGRRDSTAKHISQCLNTLLDAVDSSRNVLASLADVFYDGNDDGIELDSIRKVLEGATSEDKSRNDTNAVVAYLEEVDVVRDMMEDAVRWESKLLVSLGNEGREEECTNGNGSSGGTCGESALTAVAGDLYLPQQSLASAEDLVLDGRSLSFVPRSLVLLVERIECAHSLRVQIRQWSENNSDHNDNVKYITSMIKEANRINLSFPELSILSKVHRDAEEWMDRATVAIRSKISLSELETLVQTGEKMPVGLSGPLEKLQSRYNQACEWITTLKELVPCPTLDGIGNASVCNLDAIHCAGWLHRMHKSLNNNINNDDNSNNDNNNDDDDDNSDDEKSKALIELSAQGSRLPVDVNFLQLLQMAIDSRNWSLKAKRWIPCGGSSGNHVKRGKGKIADLEDHLSGADGIHDKIQVLTDGKSELELDFEKDLRLIVKRAKDWFEKYRPYLEGDNRKSKARSSISYVALVQIVSEADNIPTNLGNASIKMTRIYTQAKSWMDNNSYLLSRCGINIQIPTDSTNRSLTIDEVNSAIESASKDLPIDLEEVKQLGKIAKESQDWFDQALRFAPKRKVRRSRNLEEKHSIDQIVTLIDEASKVPMDTLPDVERLKMQLSDTMSWRLDTQVQIREIVNLFATLKKERISYYGLPEHVIKNLTGVHKNRAEVSAEQYVVEENVPYVTASKVDLEDVEFKSTISRISSGKGVYRMVTKLLTGARMMPVLTAEEEVAENLSTVTTWCKKAANIIGSPNDVYTEKRLVNDLLDMLVEGKRLLTLSEFSAKNIKHGFDDKSLMKDLHHNWSVLVSDDVVRLEKLQAQQTIFFSWCEKAKHTLQENGKKIPIEVLNQLAEESAIYPPNADIVKKIRKDSAAAILWAKSAEKIIKAERSISLDEVKAKVDDGAKLNFICPEFRTLRNDLKLARGWANKVKRSGLDEGSAQIIEIKELIREHDKFIISLPAEVETLKQAMCGYCLCRRPYDGFMIGCDECEEWYHGPCIGVSEAQAEKVKKFVCVRCHVRKLYNISCNCIASVIRKWCDPKELSKARSADSGKHQRKVREKRKELEKWQKELTTNTLSCSNSPNPLTSICETVSVHEKINSSGADASSNSNEIKSSQLSCDTIQKDNTENSMKAQTMLDQCNQRLEELSQIANGRKATENEEDEMQYYFYYWCVMLRCRVFAPATGQSADHSRPPLSLPCNTPEDLLSEPMVEILRASEKMNIHHLPDISSVKNSLMCASWCLFVFNILMKRPEMEKISALVDLSTTVKLPEVKSREMLRSMVSRAMAWQAKCNKVLAPIAGDAEPFDSEAIKDLRSGLNAIPIITQEEKILHSTIAHGGRRYCICGGPFDGSTMMSCNKCNELFHEKCINANIDLEREKESGKNEWFCKSCASTGEEITSQNGNGKIKGNKYDQNQIIDYVIDEDVSPHAPNPMKLWPPFGLADTAEAATALGIAVTLNYEHLEIPIPRAFGTRDLNQYTNHSSNVSYQPNTLDGNFVVANQIVPKESLESFSQIDIPTSLPSNGLNQITATQIDKRLINAKQKRLGIKPPKSEPLEGSVALGNCVADLHSQLSFVNVPQDTTIQVYPTEIDSMSKGESNIQAELISNHNNLSGKSMSTVVTAEVVSAHTSSYS